MTTTLERGTPAQRDVVRNLVQLYIHDFNDFLSPERKIGVGDNGRFDDDVLHVDSYFHEAARSVWLIREAGALAGFALLNKNSHCGRPVDFNMGEFFVTRTFRGQGIGARAAKDLIEMHAGQWEISVGARNIPAQKFWPRVVASTSASKIETLQGDGEQWTGPITRFVVG